MRTILRALILAFAAAAAGAMATAAESDETIAKFRASFEKRMNAELDEHGRKARTLREKYLEALQNLKAELGRADNLKGATQVVAEIEAIEDGEETELPEDADYRLSRLRKTWEDSLERILRERSENLKTTANLYLKALDDEKRKLTRAGKIKEALLFEEEEKRVRALPEVSAVLDADSEDGDIGDVALKSRGATVSGAFDGEALIDGKTPIAERHSFAWGRIPCAIEVTLQEEYQLDRIRFLLWNGDKRTYRYRLSVSGDDLDWKVVKDSAGSDESGWQEIELNSEAVRYIKILGLGNSANNMFHVVELEAYPSLR